MKKVFRMQYEPCNGDCYAHGQEFFKLMKSLLDDEAKFKTLTEKLVKIHEPLCGNVNLRYAMDLDENTGVYIGTFTHYGRLELFSNKDPIKLMDEMADNILKHFKSDRWQEELEMEKGLGHSVCHYGEDEDLRKFIRRTAELAM